MSEKIITGRLVLRPLEPADRETLAALLENEEIKKTYMVPDFASDEALFGMIDRIITLSRDDARFVRGIHLENTLIGMINDVDMTDDTVEVGYVIHPARWHNGYATEALRAAITALFRAGFAIVRAGAFEENAASIRVMEKCGMQKIDAAEDISYRGAMHRCVYYEIKAERSR